MKKFKRKWKSSFTLMLSIIIGCILGITLKEKVVVLKPLGSIFINMMFVIVVPLVFFLISSSIAKFGTGKKVGKIILTSLTIFLLTSLISSLFMLSTLSIAHPNIEHTIQNETIEIEKINLGEKIVETLTVSDFSNLLSKNHLLPLILFSILFGFGVSASKEKGESMKKWLESGTEVLIKIIDIIMYYAPIGILAFFANLTTELGAELIGTYASFLIIYIVASVLYFVIFYSLYAFLANGKLGLKNMWKNILPSTFTSLATCSSIATLPVNIETTKKLNISEEISSVSCSTGAATHMEGSSMGTVLKIIFLFAIFGKNFFTIQNIAITILLSTFICTVMSGIPSGGLISEMLMISLFGFPPSSYPLLTTIAWLIDAPATCLNATGDIPSTMMISKLLEKS